MSGPTLLLLSLLGGGAVMLTVADLRRRTGRGTPASRVRTGLTRWPGRGGDRGVLAAGLAAQVLGPVLARAAAAVRRAEAAELSLRRARAAERDASSRRDSYVQRWSAEGRRLPAHPRWHRYLLYVVVLGVDVLVGTVAAHLLNIQDPDALGFGASAGFLLFFGGKLTGAGLRRLDLAGTSGANDLGTDLGQRWVSKTMIAAGIVGLVGFLIGFTAARVAGQAITDAALATTLSSTPGLAGGSSTPHVPALATVLTGALAVGSWVATLVVTLRGHPDTSRIEELEASLRRARRRTQRAVRTAERAMAASAAGLALAAAALAEAAARVDGPDTPDDPAMLASLRTRLHALDQAHAALASRWVAEHRDSGTSIGAPAAGQPSVPAGNGSHA